MPRGISSLDVLEHTAKIQIEADIIKLFVLTDFKGNCL